VGRKTANVVLQELYGISSGFVVDTHVLRLSRLLGLSHAKDAVRMEKDLMQKVPPKYWMDLSLYLIFLGRSACVARRPRCTECVLSDVCPSSTAVRAGSKTGSSRSGRAAQFSPEN
jgi:endonuclease-3